MANIKKVWLLQRIEWCGHQCTGSGRETVLLGVFDSKPALVDLAPFIGPWLSKNMGVAIAQVATLQDKGVLDCGPSYDFKLYEVELNTNLEPV